jgi:hypothetical protein
MTRRLLLLALAVGFLVVARPPAASAECHTEYVPQLLDGAVVLQATQVCTPDAETVVAVDPATDEQSTDACILEILQALLDPVEYCDIEPDEVEDVVTPGLVAAALRTIPLPPSELQVQPANGRTLVNFATNFFTSTGPFDRTVTLLGQRVDLRIVPSGFGWRFGDGEALETSDAGAPYPDLRVTHTYQRKGAVAPAVDTTYTATYRVNGGPWADVPGSVTVPGVPVGLEVLTATPVLVGY